MGQEGMIVRLHGETPVRRGGRHRQGTAADRGVGRGGDGRGAGQRATQLAGVRRQHAGVHDPRGRSARSTGSTLPSCGPGWRTSTSSWWSGATTTGRTWPRCALHPGVQPLMIGVDGGADALLEAGYRPHVIVGDMDSVSDTGLLCGAELVVHAYPDGRAPGPGTGAAARPAVRCCLGPGHQRGHRAAPGRREGRQPDRRGRHPLQPRRVPRQGPGRDPPAPS